MRENREDKISRQRTLTRLSVISLIVGVVAVFAVIAGIMIKNGVISKPKLFGDLFEDSDESADIETGDYSAMIAALSDISSYETASEDETEGQGKYYVRHDVTEEECRELLYSLQPCERYTAVYELEIYSLDRSEVCRRNIKMWKDGEKFRIDIYESEKLISSVKCGEDKITVTDNLGKESSQTYTSTDETKEFTAESYAGLPALSAVIDVMFADSTKDEVSISLSSDGDETLYEVSYPNPTLKEQTESYYISVKYGIFVRAESIYNGKVIYSISAVSFYPELIGESDTLFG